MPLVGALQDVTVAKVALLEGVTVVIGEVVVAVAVGIFATTTTTMVLLGSNGETATTGVAHHPAGATAVTDGVLEVLLAGVTVMTGVGVGGESVRMVVTTAVLLGPLGIALEMVAVGGTIVETSATGPDPPLPHRDTETGIVVEMGEVEGVTTTAGLGAWSETAAGAATDHLAMTRLGQRIGFLPGGSGWVACRRTSRTAISRRCSPNTGHYPMSSSATQTSTPLASFSSGTLAMRTMRCRT